MNDSILRFKTIVVATTWATRLPLLSVTPRHWLACIRRPWWSCM